MKATCRCGTCGFRWFRCICPDMAIEQMAPESTWPFWRNMTKRDVEAYMANIGHFEELRRLMDDRMKQLWSVCQ